MAETPLGAVIKGLLAGMAGTALMDATGYLRYRVAEHGEQAPLAWEFSTPHDWERVSAPAKLGRRFYEAITQRPLDPRWAPLTSTLMHWGYGTAWGAAYGVVAGSRARVRRWSGPLFGSLVWASSYVVLPIAGLYKPIWAYSPSELVPDLGVHLAYGTGTALAFGSLRRR